jgi:flagellar M-ring protein FliF
MAIEVATAESAAAKLSAQQAREAHEAEIARIAEEAMSAAQEAARLAEEARLAAEAKAEADALAAQVAAEALMAQADGNSESAEIEIQEGESLEEVKARMAAMKPKKQSISADLLNTANSYDDKVALIRMIVAEDSTRVAGVLKSLIR